MRDDPLPGLISSLLQSFARYHHLFTVCKACRLQHSCLAGGGGGDGSGGMRKIICYYDDGDEGRRLLNNNAYP